MKLRNWLALIFAALFGVPVYASECLPGGGTATGVVPGNIPIDFLLYDSSRQNLRSFRSFYVSYVTETAEGERYAELKGANQQPFGPRLSIPGRPFLVPNTYSHNSFDPSPPIFEVDVTLPRALLSQFCVEAGDRVIKIPRHLRKLIAVRRASRN